MKRVFSVPVQPETRQDNPAPEQPVQQPRIPAPHSPVYVRQVTDQHQNAIARILARVRSHPQDPTQNEQQKREE